MKSFYEMLEILESTCKKLNEEEGDPGLGDQDGPVQDQGQDQIGQDQDQMSSQPQQEELKHYMFFSNLKTIRTRVEEMLKMDPREVDAMLQDGHDWASDHISTSKDDIEEVCNWLNGMKDQE